MTCASTSVWHEQSSRHQNCVMAWTTTLAWTKLRPINWSECEGCGDWTTGQDIDVQSISIGQGEQLWRAEGLLQQRLCKKYTYSSVCMDNGTYSICPSVCKPSRVHTLWGSGHSNNALVFVYLSIFNISGDHTMAALQLQNKKNSLFQSDTTHWGDVGACDHVMDVELFV